MSIVGSGQVRCQLTWARRLLVILAAGVLLAGCTTTLEPAPSSTANTSTSARASTERSSEPPDRTTDPATSAPSEQTATTPAATDQTAASSFAPTPDADPVDGACPYLTKDQVQSATGDRMGGVEIRPAEPQPVCEFTGTGGDFLATVRVLQLPTDALAVSAVDFYVPRDNSNPESRPTGWSGGSMPTDAGYMVAVSKGRFAVIAEANQPQSVSARELVLDTIKTLDI